MSAQPPGPAAGGAGWGAMLASSGVLSLALLGDALIYAVLPVHAAAFGVSLAWVGILLSVNRFVRVFLYGWIARVSLQLGLRNTCIIASVGAVVSTAAYGLGGGDLVLLAARVLWGLVYAALLLVTLAYAVERRERAGARIGWSRAVQRIGPIAALLGGAWLTAILGPRDVFLVLAGMSLLAVPLSMTLPRDRAVQSPPARTPALGRPTPLDVLFFIQGFGVDGVFALTITLILAREHSLSVAVMSGGALLAMRQVTEAVAAPVFGTLADRFGAMPMLVASIVLTALGFAIVAAGYAVAGAVVMLVFRGALTSLGPAAVVQDLGQREPALAPLARMQAWRDLGAALGPLFAGYALVALTPETMHGAMAALMLLALLGIRRAATS